jgi:hypothetical protein
MALRGLMFKEETRWLFHFPASNGTPFMRLFGRYRRTLVMSFSSPWRKPSMEAR